MIYSWIYDWEICAYSPIKLADHGGLRHKPSGTGQGSAYQTATKQSPVPLSLAVASSAAKSNVTFGKPSSFRMDIEKLRQDCLWDKIIAHYEAQKQSHNGALGKWTQTL